MPWSIKNLEDMIQKGLVLPPGLVRMSVFIYMYVRKYVFTYSTSCLGPQSFLSLSSVASLSCSFKNLSKFVETN